MARFDANTTFRQMWLSMDKNIDWAKGPEGQKLLRTIKAKGSAPSFGTGSLYGDFQNDLLTGSGKVRNQVADMYKNYYGIGDSSAPASSQPSTSSRSSALARTSGRGSVVRQSAPTSTNAGTPSSNGGGLARTSRHQGGARARQGVSVRGGGVPTPGNPGGYGTPRATPKPSSVTSSVPAGGGSGRGFGGTKSVAGGLKGSLVVGAVDALADLAVPHISREAVRGALVVTGNDTTGFDKLMSGKPVVKNIGGVSYNIATEEGRKGYKAALSKNPEKGSADLPSRKKMVKNKDGRLVPANMPASRNMDEIGPVVTGPDGQILTADPNNPGFMLTPDGQSVRGDLTGGKGPVSEDQGTGYPTLAAPESSTGPQRSVPDPAGSGAKGTQTGFQGYKIDLGIAEESLGRKIADVNSFLSENLPVVGYRDQGGREIRPTGDDLSELQGSYADGLISKDQLIFEGISTPGKNGVSPADVADNKRSVRIPGDMDDMDPMFDETGGADDDDFGGPDPEDYATNYSARRTAQRNAFLDPSITNSVTAVRAANNAIGRAKFGNEHYFNDGGTLRKVTKEAYEKQGSTGLSVDEIKGAYVDSVKETLVPVATAGVFDEDMDLGPISEGVTLNSPVDMGDMSKTEFDFNNVAPVFSTPREQMKVNYFADVNYDADDDED